MFFTSIFIVNTIQTNRFLDSLADAISKNGGVFPDFDKMQNNKEPPPRKEFFDKESQFTTRFFIVYFDKSGNAIHCDMRKVASVSETEAEEYATKVLEKNKERGWYDNYRYKVYGTDSGTAVLFVNGSTHRNASDRFMWTAFGVFAAGSIIVILLVALISGKAVRPVAEGYEKQKQFITDAGHELKTPLTLILANLDIAEDEVGKNEWLDDIRDESLHMSELVSRLVGLARMDEDGAAAQKSLFSLDGVVRESVEYFGSLAESRGLSLISDIQTGVDISGDENMIRQLLSILIDNALKYCDKGGNITVSLKQKRVPVLSVSNDYADVGKLELDRLFDRFYRADPARTAGDGFGIGLSSAKSIVEKHKGSIHAENVDGKVIRFTVKL